MMAVSIKCKIPSTWAQQICYYVPAVSQMVTSIFVLVFRLFEDRLF